MCCKHPSRHNGGDDRMLFLSTLADCLAKPVQSGDYEPRRRVTVSFGAYIPRSISEGTGLVKFWFRENSLRSRVNMENRNLDKQRNVEMSWRLVSRIRISHPRPRSFVGKLATRQMLLPLLEPLPHVGSGTTPGASTTSTVHPSRCIRPGIATFFDSFRRWIFETKPVTIFFNRVCDKLCIDLLLVASQTASHLPKPPCPMFPTGMLHMPFVRCKFVRCLLSSWMGSRPTKIQ
jgi:hypothetical protein